MVRENTLAKRASDMWRSATERALFAKAFGLTDANWREGDVAAYARAFHQWAYMRAALRGVQQSGSLNASSRKSHFDDVVIAGSAFDDALEALRISETDVFATAESEDAQ